MLSTRLLLSHVVLVAGYAPHGASPAVAHRAAAPQLATHGQLRMVASLEKLLDEPESAAPSRFSDSWYAIGYSADIGTEMPFGTRFWGEPVVLFRNAEGEMQCVRDVCPHRSAPLSMGEVQGGVLRCFYHGWGFGTKGECVDVPTAGAGNPSKAACATSYAVVERDGLVWVWRGNVLSADARKLPAASSDASSRVVVDTTLDYGAEWSALVARRLEAPQLGASGATSSSSSSSSAGGADAADKAPVIVRHSGVRHAGELGALGACEEEAFVVPIAPGRSRVLLRQHFDVPFFLAPLMQISALRALITLAVQSRNYESATDEAPALATAASSSRRGAEATAFLAWLSASEQLPEGNGYFARWAKSDGAQFGMQQADESFGTYGLKRNYVRDTPLAAYAPLRPSPVPSRVPEAIIAALIAAPLGLLFGSI